MIALALCWVVAYPLLGVAGAIERGAAELSREAVFQLFSGMEPDIFRHNVFVEGESPAIKLVFLMSKGKVREPATLSYRVHDFWGRVVASGKAIPNVVGFGGNVTLTPEVNGVGWYRIDIEFEDGDGPIGVRYQATPGETREREPMVTFAVVPRRSKTSTEADTPFAVDAATSWLVGRDRYETLAELMRLAGVSWARDRLSWGGVQPAAGQVPDWGRYAESAKAQHTRGIRILQVFHDSPAWARTGGSIKLPEDLMAVYNFAREAADDLGGSVMAWEFWNEQDIGFATEPADHYAAALKAAALGFRRAASRPQVALGPFALEPGDYAELLFANGVAPYLDIYSFHTYADATTGAYEGVLSNHIRFASQHGMGDKPLWITESGRPFARGPVGSFDVEAKAQVEYLIKAYVKALSLGIDRFFWFILPHYMERGTQFGILRADLTPLPAYSALVALTSALGKGRYLGRANVGDAVAYIFNSGSEEVAVVWSDREGAVEIPASQSDDLRVIDAMGRMSFPTREGDSYSIQVGRLPVFIAGIDRAAWPLEEPAGIAADHTVGPATQSAPTEDLNLNVVLFNRFKPEMLPSDRKSPPRGYLFIPGEPIELTVQVYNFGEEAIEGTLSPALPEGFKIDPAGVRLSVGAMDKAEAQFTLIPSARLDGDDYLVRVEGTFGGKKVTPAVSRLVADWAKAAKTVDLREVAGGQLPRWRINISGNGTSTIEQTPQEARSGIAAFTHRFPRPGDRWAYPILDFGRPIDLRRYAGIRFRVFAEKGDPNTLVRVMLVEPNGSTFFSGGGYTLSGGQQELTFLFRDLSHGSWSAPDDNGRLDLDRIVRIQFGCNTTSDEVSYRVEAIQLLER